MKKGILWGTLLIIGVLLGVFGTKVLMTSTESTERYYNILDYGAQPDRPSFDNAEVFNQIIQSMDNQGGIIYIPNGNYYVNSSIIIDRSYVTIKGDSSGLRSGIDGENDKTQGGGGGAKLITKPGISAIKIYDSENEQRISGVTFKSFQIRGEGNNGVGIHGIQDTDRIIVDDLVIHNVGVGIQLKGADAPSIQNSWIAETETSIYFEGASQQVNIANNSLGAQPKGVTILMENAQWFNITGNNIYPDGQSAIRILNPVHGTISSNTISSYYHGMIEFLPAKGGVYGNGNVISSNMIAVENYKGHPKKYEHDWGIIHIEGYNNLISSNQIIADGMTEDFVVIRIVRGDQNRIAHNSIAVTNDSTQKIKIDATANETVITHSIFKEELSDDGQGSIHHPLNEN